MTPEQRAQLVALAAMAQHARNCEGADAARAAIDELDDRAEDFAHCSRCGTVLFCDGVNADHVSELERKYRAALETIESMGGGL